MIGRHHLIPDSESIDQLKNLGLFVEKAVRAGFHHAPFLDRRSNLSAGMGTSLENLDVDGYARVVRSTR